VAHVYTAHVTVRHHELDGFGRLHPAVYFRYLAHAAVQASADAGFDAAWYAAAGGLWIIRRSTLDIVHPVTASERLTIRTWVEDFRRVRSHRCYEVGREDGSRVAGARTDWVYVDAASGRPRRIPAELEAAFGVAGGGGAQPRSGWVAPPAPARPARSEHRVRLHELDGLAHVNNAVYLDLLAQATFDALEGAGWSVERLVGSGGVPILARADVEYVDAARYGDRLEIATWFTPARYGLDAHQCVVRAGETELVDRALVRATTGWRWTWQGAEPAVPADLLAALSPVLAA
jgi:acyl-CoA thioester hydrolase